MVESNQNQEANITYEQMSKFVRKREHLHEAMTRDGWKLPSKYSAIATTEWLLKVRQLEVFCIRTDDVRGGTR